MFPSDRPNRSQPPSSLTALPLHDIKQPKLDIGDVNDPLEHEADRAVDAAMAMDASTPMLRRSQAGRRLEEGRPDAASRAAVPPVANKALRSSGQALDPETRSFFEKAYQHDFGRVRIHANPEAAESAAALDASAYTAGSHIVIGGYPRANQSRRLLGHELAHVVQQGGAAPLSAFGVPPVTVNSTAPSIQRQPLKGGDWKPEKVKPLVKEKDKTAGQEIWNIVDKNDLKGTPSLVRSAVLEGKRHEWKITIKAQREGNATFPGPSGRTGQITTSTQGGVTIHTVPVTANTILGSSAEEQELFPTGKEAERVNFMAARTLYHEIMHALIAIDSELPQSEKRSQATKKYEDLRARAANDPAAIAAKEAVLSTVSAMVNNAETTIKVPDLFDSTVKAPYPETDAARAAHLAELKKSEGLDKIIGPEAVNRTAAAMAGPMDHPSVQRRKFLEDSITTLISEKNARKETGKAFGLPDYASNKRTAADYALNIPKTIQDLARRRSGNFALNLRTADAWQSAEQTLQTLVETFFAKLDEPPLQELTPGLRSSSPHDRPEPVRINP